MTAVLGIDPSLNCSGAALVEWWPDTDFPGPEWRTVRAPWRGSAPKTISDERRRIRHQIDRVLSIAPVRLDLTVIEGPAPHAAHRGKPDEIGGLRWMLIDQLLARGPVVLVDPMRRSQLATGFGRSSKDAVLDQVRADFPKMQIRDHNVADAVALAAAGAHHLGLPMPYGAEQTQAHGAVPWPDINAA